MGVMPDISPTGRLRYLLSGTDSRSAPPEQGRELGWLVVFMLERDTLLLFVVVVICCCLSGESSQQENSAGQCLSPAHVSGRVQRTG